MAMTSTGTGGPQVASNAAAKPSFFYRREVREVIYQVLLVLFVAFVFYEIVTNAAENLRRQNIASGFAFLDRTAGFDISQTPIDYANTSSYGRAFVVGILNTLIVAVIGIIFATILGFIIGISRLSKNFVVSTLASAYVEIVRNLPLLLFLFIMYFGVLKPLPSVRQSLNIGDAFFLNVRGLYMPSPEWLWGGQFVLAAVVLGLIATFFVARWAKARQMATGERFPTGWTALGLILGLPLIVFFLSGRPVSFSYPALRGFNFEGGMVVQPEFLALLIGLTIYTAAFIGEIVRAGIQGVPKGQWEAARAIGLSGGQLLRLIVIPQAARIIIPPLTSQYLNITKNSSLAVAIAYPDLVSVGGTMLNQTGQAVEAILMIMAVYLTLSLLTSAFMNWFNKKMALVER